MRSGTVGLQSNDCLPRLLYAVNQTQFVTSWPAIIGETFHPTNGVVD
jgi:hypothetical protein